MFPMFKYYSGILKLKLQLLGEYNPKSLTVQKFWPSQLTVKKEIFLINISWKFSLHLCLTFQVRSYPSATIT